jgi:hypothetical protein
MEKDIITYKGHSIEPVKIYHEYFKKTQWYVKIDGAKPEGMFSTKKEAVDDAKGYINEIISTKVFMKKKNIEPEIINFSEDFEPPRKVAKWDLVKTYEKKKYKITSIYEEFLLNLEPQFIDSLKYDVFDFGYKDGSLVRVSTQEMNVSEIRKVKTTNLAFVIYQGADDHAYWCDRNHYHLLDKYTGWFSPGTQFKEGGSTEPTTIKQPIPTEVEYNYTNYELKQEGDKYFIEVPVYLIQFDDEYGNSLYQGTKYYDEDGAISEAEGITLSDIARDEKERARDWTVTVWERVDKMPVSIEFDEDGYPIIEINEEDAEEGELTPGNSYDIKGTDSLDEEEKENTSEILSEISRHYSKKYECREAGFYTRTSRYCLIPCKDGFIQLRISNHTPNYENLSQSERNIIRQNIIGQISRYNGAEPQLSEHAEKQLEKFKKEVEDNENLFDSIITELDFLEAIEYKINKIYGFINVIIYYKDDETRDKFRSENKDYLEYHAKFRGRIENIDIDMSGDFEGYEKEDLIKEIDDTIEQEIHSYEELTSINFDLDDAYKNGGSVKNETTVQNMKSGKVIQTNNGKDGGLLIGNSHKDGGIQVVVGDTGNPVEVEGGEVIITKPSVECTDCTHEFDGKEMTNKEILSEINQEKGGVPILEDGGTIMKDGGIAVSDEATKDHYFGWELTPEEFITCSHISKDLNNQVSFSDCWGNLYFAGSKIEFEKEYNIKTKEDLKEFHKKLVETAIQENKEVPEYVLKHYPQLKVNKSSVNIANNKEIIENKISGFQTLLKYTKTKQEKEIIKQKIAGFKILLKLAIPASQPEALLESQIKPSPEVKTDLDIVIDELHYDEIEKNIYNAVGNDDPIEYLYNRETDSSPKHLDIISVEDKYNAIYEAIDEDINTAGNTIQKLNEDLDELFEQSEYKKTKAVESKIKTIQSAIEGYESGIKKLAKQREQKKLDEKYDSREFDKYIEDYTDSGFNTFYALNMEGVNMINKIRARLETRKGIKEGTDMFPDYEHSAVEEVKDKKFERGGAITYNGIRVPETISPKMIISAFQNLVDNEKVQEYSEKMKEEMLSHDFPPIEGYPRIIDQDDVDSNIEFLNGDQVTEEYIGKMAWMVTDGHHRSLAAIEANLPYLEVKLDYSTITDPEELKQFTHGGMVDKFDQLVGQALYHIDTATEYSTKKEKGRTKIEAKYGIYKDGELIKSLSPLQIIDFAKENGFKYNKGGNIDGLLSYGQFEKAYFKFYDIEHRYSAKPVRVIGSFYDMYLKNPEEYSWLMEYVEKHNEEENIHSQYKLGTVGQIIKNEGIIYAIMHYMDYDDIHESDNELRDYWRLANEQITSFEKYMHDQGYEPGTLVHNKNGFAIISDKEGNEIPINELSKYAQAEVDEISITLHRIIHHVGISSWDFENDKYGQGGNIGNNFIKEYQDQIKSLHDQIKYAEEQIELAIKPEDQWAIKEYQIVINNARKEIVRINKVIEDIHFMEIMKNPEARQLIEQLQGIGTHSDPSNQSIKIIRNKLVKQLQDDFDYTYVVDKKLNKGGDIQKKALFLERNKSSNVFTGIFE